MSTHFRERAKTRFSLHGGRIFESLEYKAPVESRRVVSNQNGTFRIYFERDYQIFMTLTQLPSRYFKARKRRGDYHWEAIVRKDGRIVDEVLDLFTGFLKQYKFRAPKKVHEELADLREEFERQREEDRQAITQSFAVDAELPEIELGGELRPFQRGGVAYALARRKTFIADQMGLGKTMQAIATIKALDAFRALIICPKSVKIKWMRELSVWLPNDYATRDPEDMRYAIPKILVINYDILVKWYELLEQVDWKAIVIDESHYIKNPDAQRTKAMQDIVKVSSKSLEAVLCLTGTPVLNHPTELIVPLELMGYMKPVFGGRSQFKYDYTGACKENRWNAKGTRNLPQLNQKMRASCYIRRLKKDVLKELPAKSKSVIEIDIDNRSEYDLAERDLITWLQQRLTNDEDFMKMIEELEETEREAALKERRREIAQRSFPIIAKIEYLQQIASIGKVKTIVRWVKDFLEGGDKLVIFANHREVQRALAKATPKNVYTRENGDKSIQHAIDQFQTDASVRTIVASLKGDSTGIDLTAASDVVFAEWAWTPAIHEQAGDRCHRIGQRDNVMEYYFLAVGTIEEYIYRVLERKRRIVDASTDGKVVQQELSMAGEIVKNLLKKDCA